MNKKNTLTALAIASLVALTGCSTSGQNSTPVFDSGPRQGVVIDKEHEPGEWEKKKVCTKKVNNVCKAHKENREWDDDDYSLLIKEGDRENWVEVDAFDYSEFEEGETYTVK